jgi:hypothetical protein
MCELKLAGAPEPDARVTLILYSVSELASVRAALALSWRRGEPFSTAWPRVVAVASGWGEALEATESAWKRAYDHEPASSGDDAVRVLGDAADSLQVAAWVWPPRIAA